MKHAITSVCIAICVGLFGPRDLADFGKPIVYIGVTLVRLGLLLDPPFTRGKWHDDKEREPLPYIENASAFSHEARA